MSDTNYSFRIRLLTFVNMVQIMKILVCFATGWK